MNAILLFVWSFMPLLFLLYGSYGDWEGTSSVHLVLAWPRHINLWERHINLWERDMLWPRDCFVEVTTSISRGLDLLMLREGHIFLVATSLMSKQIYVTIATRDYQRWIKQLFCKYCKLLTIMPILYDCRLFMPMRDDK